MTAPVTCSFTYLPEGFTLECVRYEDGTVRFNLMPDPAAAAPVPQIEAASPPESAPEPSPASALDAIEAPMTLATAPTKKQRTFKGLVRAMWTAVFSFGGEALVYGLNNLTALNLPPGVGLAIGAAGYGLKAAAFPNSKL